MFPLDCVFDEEFELLHQDKKRTMKKLAQHTNLIIYHDFVTKMYVTTPKPKSKRQKKVLPIAIIYIL